ncbi:MULTISPECIES: hypothetical protein [unclassified Sphingomonas]|jgi:hypothetical protein|nr:MULTISPECIES: hypothetical protein [unclassified Sphingomonas]
MHTIKHVGEYGVVALAGAALMVAATALAKIAADGVILIGEAILR